MLATVGEARNQGRPFWACMHVSHVCVVALPHFVPEKGGLSDACQAAGKHGDCGNVGTAKVCSGVVK